MGYMLNEDQQSIVDMAHDFCEKEIKPYAAEWDREGIFPLETVKKAMEKLTADIVAWRRPSQTPDDELPGR